MKNLDLNELPVAVYTTKGSFPLCPVCGATVNHGSNVFRERLHGEYVSDMFFLKHTKGHHTIWKCHPFEHLSLNEPL